MEFKGWNTTAYDGTSTLISFKKQNNASVNVTQPLFFALITLEMFSGIYVLFCLVIFECKWQSLSSSVAQNQAKWLRIIALVATSTAVIYFAITEIYPIAKDTNMCLIHFALQKSAYNCAINTVYVFLWFRQKMFYSNPSLEYLYTKKLRVFSWTVLFIILVCFLSQILMNIFGSLDSNRTTQNGTSCQDANSKLWLVQIILGSTTSTIAHLSLLSLFVYPLKQHKMRTAQMFTRGTGGSVVSRQSANYPAYPLKSPNHNDNNFNSLKRTLSNRSNSSFKIKPNDIGHSHEPLQLKLSTDSYSSNMSLKKDQEKQATAKSRKIGYRLHLLIKRCLILTVICVVANITSTVITVKLYQGGLLAPCLYGLNLIINLMCCIGCFSHWKLVLIPCRKTKSKKRWKKHRPSNNKIPLNSETTHKNSETIV